MKNIVKCGGVLFIISAVVALILAGINVVTADKIASNDVEKTNKALSEVMQADSFEKIEDISAYTDENTQIREIYTAALSGGSIKGYCFNVSGTGYGGKDSVNLIIGVSTDDTITGVSVISQGETAGLGANIVNEAFREQFVGESTADVNKAPGFENEPDGKINALSGATVTTKATLKCTNEAVECAKKLIGENALAEESQEGGAVIE